MSEHRELVERLWAEGKTSCEIAAAMGVYGYYAGGQYISRLRARGYNLPHRRPGTAAYMAVHGAERMALARAARKVAA